MDKFFVDHGLSQILSEKLKSHGVTDETFFCMSDEFIVKIFNDDADSLMKFLPLYTIEKYKLSEKNPLVEVLDTEVDGISDRIHDVLDLPSEAPSSSACDASMTGTSASNSSFDLHIDYSLDIFGDSNDKVKRQKNFELYFPEIEDGVELKRNKLYYELQDSVLGRIIIGKYRHSKILDLDKLKNFCIIRRLKEEINYKITTEEFLEDVALMKELFVPLDTDLLYRPYRQSATSRTSLAIQGPLYNRYRYFLEEGRRAGLISSVPDRSRKRPHVADVNHEESPSERLKILTDTSRESYQVNDVIERWNNTFDYRIREFLSTSSAKKARIKDRVKAYINTFKCLQKTDEILLLKSDFKRIIMVLAEKVKLPYNIESVNTLFQTVWPEKAKIILKNLSKNKDVNSFLCENKGILTEVDPSISALFLLPLTLTGYTKKVKSFDPHNGNDETITLSKQEISKHFILRIEDPNNFAQEKIEFENWQRRYNINTHPYVIFVGPLTYIHAGYVIFNGHTYMYDNPLEAIEVCFQLYTALHYWPELVEHVWQFITECVYEIKTQTDDTAAFVSKSYLPISTYVCKIKPK